MTREITPPTASHRRQNRHRLRVLKLKLLFALSALALTGAALVAMGDSEGSRPGQVETWESTRGETAEPLQLRWLSPLEEERLTGTVELKWELFQEEIRSLDVWVDERHLLQVAPSDRQRVINTEYLSNGPHRLELRAVDAAGRSLRAAVDVRVHNRDFSIRGVSRPQGALKNGEELVLEVTTRGSGFLPQADLTAIDSAFDARRISWNQPKLGVYQLRYRLSSANERPDGRYRVPVRLVDQIEPSIREQATVRVDLSNTPRFSDPEPPVEITCGVFRPEPLLPSDETTQTLERIEGPARAAVGTPVSLHLSWATPKAPEGRFLKVSIDGVQGHFALHGSCSLRDEIPLVARRLSGAEGYRIAIWPGNGLPVVHQLVVIR